MSFLLRDWNSILLTIRSCQQNIDCNSCFRLVDFKDNPEDRVQFWSFIEEAKLVARTSLHVAVDASRDLATGIIMRRNSQLQSLCFPRDIQNMIQDLPYDELNLFIGKMNEFLCLLNNSISTLHFLGIYTLATRRKQQRQAVKPRPPPLQAFYHQHPVESLRKHQRVQSPCFKAPSTAITSTQIPATCKGLLLTS